MKTRTAAIVLAAVLTAPAFAAETTQASEAATTFCKLSATIAHDAVLARLNGEERAQAEKRLQERFMPAAKHEKAREIVRENRPSPDGCRLQNRTAARLEKIRLQIHRRRSRQRRLQTVHGNRDVKLIESARQAV